MGFPGKTLVFTLITVLSLLPCSEILFAMTVPSDFSAREQEQKPSASGGYYYYNTSDRLFLLLETALYIGLAVGALIILDQYTDDLTIIVYE